MEEPEDDNANSTAIGKDLVFKSTHPEHAVPHFNASIYTKSESGTFEEIGKIEEIFGTLSETVFTLFLSHSVFF